jgi:glycosyltransferase involved in cell wall biosynthesis
MHVVPIGVDAGDAPAPGRDPKPPALGYLARMAESMGLGRLVDAWLRLKKVDRFKDLRLHLSGGKTGDDTAFLEGLRKRFADEGVAGDVRFFDEFDPKSRRAFLDSISLLSVPAPHGVAFGTYILEAGARGVPVVQPKIGSFPELVGATGGGVLYEPNDLETLVKTLSELLDNPERRAELGRKGRESVAQTFSLGKMAQQLVEVYRPLVPAARVADRSPA